MTALHYIGRKIANQSPSYGMVWYGMVWYGMEWLCSKTKNEPQNNGLNKDAYFFLIDLFFAAGFDPRPATKVSFKYMMAVVHKHVLYLRKFSFLTNCMGLNDLDVNLRKLRNCSDQTKYGSNPSD
jgi:hypothetical protein